MVQMVQKGWDVGQHYVHESDSSGAQAERKQKGRWWIVDEAVVHGSGSS